MIFVSPVTLTSSVTNLVEEIVTRVPSITKDIAYNRAFTVAKHNSPQFGHDDIEPLIKAITNMSNNFSVAVKAVEIYKEYEHAYTLAHMCHDALCAAVDAYNDSYEAKMLFDSASCANYSAKTAKLDKDLAFNIKMSAIKAEQAYITAKSVLECQKEIAAKLMTNLYSDSNMSIEAAKLMVNEHIAKHCNQPFVVIR